MSMFLNVSSVTRASLGVAGGEGGVTIIGKYTPGCHLMTSLTAGPGKLDEKALTGRTMTAAVGKGPR